MRILLVLCILCMACIQDVQATERPGIPPHIAETKTIRCGYIPYEPFLIVDPNTKKLSGIMVDYMNRVAEQNGYKIDFVAETPVEQIAPALNAGKIDVFCLPASPEKNWIKVIDMPALMWGLPYYIYVDPKKTWTDETLALSRFVRVDGYVQSKLTDQFYPKSPRTELSAMASTAEQYDQIKYNKADAIINEPISAENYMRNNPGIMVRFGDKPIYAQPFYVVTQKGNAEMFDFIDRLFAAKNGNNRAVLKEVAKNYDIPDETVMLDGECDAPITDTNGEQSCP